MDEATPTQTASRELTDALFAIPEFRQRFEMMAKETSTREPVPDDFSWLSQDAEPEEFLRSSTDAQTLGGRNAP